MAYAGLHSPLREVLAAALGISSRGCYLCLASAPGDRIVEALAATLLVLIAAVGAWALVDRLDVARYERPVAFGLMALALVTGPAAAVGGLASLTGTPLLRPPTGLLLCAVPGALVVSLAARGGWRPSLTLSWRLPATPLLRLMVIGAAALVAAQVAVTFVHPATQGDALSYHAPLGVLLWRGGDLTTHLQLNPATYALWYPATAELWSGALRLLAGERLANLGQLPFALLGASAVFAFTRRTGLQAGAALLAACGFLLVPIVTLQVGTQANDVTGAALVMSAIALTSAPLGHWGPRRAALVGLALGLAVTTKLALFPSVVVIAAVVLATIARSQPRTGRWRGRELLAFVLPFLVIVGPWWLRNLVLEANPLYPQALPLYGHGVNIHDLGTVDHSFVPHPLAWPAYPLVEPIDERSGFGALFAVAILPGLVMAAARARRRPLALWFAGLLFTLPVWWAYTLHEPRFLLPYVGLGLAFVPWALLAVQRHRRTVAAVLMGGAAVLGVALTIEQGVLPLARQPVSRSAFYDRVWGVDPAALALPEREGVLLVTGFGLGRIDYVPTYPLLGPRQRRMVVPLDASDIRGSREVIVRRMHRAGLRYAYVAPIPAYHAEVARLFAPPRFELVRASAIVPGAPLGARRTVFRRAKGSEADSAIRRLLYRLTPVASADETSGRPAR